MNIHTSILPKYRGAAPIHRSIMNGENSIGVSTFIINQNIDSGKIISQKTIKFNDKIIYEDLFNKLSILGSELMLNSIDILEKKGWKFLLGKEMGDTSSKVYNRIIDMISEDNTLNSFTINRNTLFPI